MFNFQLRYVLIFALIFFSINACKNDDSTTTTADPAEFSLLINLPKIDSSVVNSNLSTSKSLLLNTQQSKSTEESSCPTSAIVPSMYNSIVEFYISARSLNFFFSCNDYVINYSKWINVSGISGLTSLVIDGKKRWWYKDYLFFEATKFTDTNLFKGYYIQNLPDDDESNIDVRVEYDDSIAGQQKRFAYLVGMNLKIKLELTKFNESGDVYFQTYIDGGGYNLSLTSYVEVKKDSAGNPTDEVQLAVGKASCMVLGDSPVPCSDNAGLISNDEIKYFNSYGEEVPSNAAILQKLNEYGADYITVDAESFNEQFEIPNQ